MAGPNFTFVGLRRAAFQPTVAGFVRDLYRAASVGGNQPKYSALAALARSLDGRNIQITDDIYTFLKLWSDKDPTRVRSFFANRGEDYIKLEKLYRDALAVEAANGDATAIRNQMNELMEAKASDGGYALWQHDIVYVKSGNPPTAYTTSSISGESVQHILHELLHLYLKTVSHVNPQTKKDDYPNLNLPFNAAEMKKYFGIDRVLWKLFRNY